MPTKQRTYSQTLRGWAAKHRTDIAYLSSVFVNSRASPMELQKCISSAALSGKDLLVKFASFWMSFTHTCTPAWSASRPKDVSTRDNGQGGCNGSTRSEVTRPRAGDLDRNVSDMDSPGCSGPAFPTGFDIEAEGACYPSDCAWGQKPPISQGGMLDTSLVPYPSFVVIHLSEGDKRAQSCKPEQNERRLCARYIMAFKNDHPAKNAVTPHGGHRGYDSDNQTSSTATLNRLYGEHPQHLTQSITTCPSSQLPPLVRHTMYPDVSLHELGDKFHEGTYSILFVIPEGLPQVRTQPEAHRGPSCGGGGTHSLPAFVV